MILSEHAKKRLRQRGLPRRVVKWLWCYGEIDYQAGAELYYFTKRARRALARDVGERLLRRHEKALDAYMVCSEGTVTTVGHRYQRVVRH